jgi:hypothetical protein
VDLLDQPIAYPLRIRHRRRSSPTPIRPDPDDPIARADAAVEAARAALRLLDALDESSSSRNEPRTRDPANGSAGQAHAGPSGYDILPPVIVSVESMNVGPGRTSLVVAASDGPGG